MNEIEKRQQLESVLSLNNVKIILDVLRSCALETRTRILDNEFETIVYNAKVEGQLELLANFERFANDYLTPKI